MRLHTNVVTERDIYAATRRLTGVYATVRSCGSRTHDHAFEVKLEGNGYRSNPGVGGRFDVPVGATWDEWGTFIATLYEVDSQAMWGSVKYPVYRDAADFHFQTDDRFSDPQAGLPSDTHKRHSWMWGVGQGECRKCSARVFRH
jgi:hypothetical protein